MTETAIQAHDLSRTFKGGIEAVRGVSLDIAEGEMFGFLGPNGAGKSTMVRMLCTLLPPSGGRASVAGHDVVSDSDAVRRSIGVALQEIGLDPVQTGRELLELQCGLYGIRGAAGRERAAELLELVGLTDAAERRTKTYSGGMKRRLDLASALVHQPEVLFLDEPTTGLDPASRLTVWQEVRDINANGTTIFLTTQYLEEADELCERLAIIDNGEIVAEGTPEKLKAEIGDDVVSVALSGADAEETREVIGDLPGLDRIVAEPDALHLYVKDGATSIAEIVRRLDAASVEVGAISVSRPSLDDVFLEATGRRLEAPGTRSRTREPSTTKPRRRRCCHERSPAARPPRGQGGRPLPRGDDPRSLHPALLPRRQHRPGRDDIPGQHHPLPARTGLRRVPVAGLADVRRRHSDHRTRPGHRDRQRLFRQAPGRADPPYFADPRAPDRRPRPRSGGIRRSSCSSGSSSSGRISSRGPPAPYSWSCSRRCSASPMPGSGSS